MYGDGPVSQTKAWQFRSRSTKTKRQVDSKTLILGRLILGGWEVSWWMDRVRDGSGFDS